MSEYNCILQRKVDNKEIEAIEINGEYYDMNGVKLVGSSYRLIDHKRDYEGVDELESNAGMAWAIVGLMGIIYFAYLVGKYS